MILVAFLTTPPSWNESSASPNANEQLGRTFVLAYSKDDDVCRPLEAFYYDLSTNILAEPSLDWEHNYINALLKLGFQLAAPAKVNLPGDPSLFFPDFEIAGGHLVQGDLLHSGHDQLVAIVNESGTTYKAWTEGPPGPPTALVYPSPDRDLQTKDAAVKFGQYPEIRVTPPFYDPLPLPVWKPPYDYDWTSGKLGGVVISYEQTPNEYIDILSHQSRLMLISRKDQWFWIEREVKENSEIRVFRSKITESPRIASGTTPPHPGLLRLTATSENVCYLSPNIIKKRK